MTISRIARWLHLDLPQEKEGNEFGVELPDEIDTRLEDITLTAEMLASGNKLANMSIPKGNLVMLVKEEANLSFPTDKWNCMKETNCLLSPKTNHKWSFKYA